VIRCARVGIAIKEGGCLDAWESEAECFTATKSCEDTGDGEPAV
jgi:hypothetical protein